MANTKKTTVMDQLSAILEEAETGDILLEKEAKRLDQYLPAGRSCWRQLYNWPELSGRLLGLLKTVVQNPELSGEMESNPAYKYAAVTFKAMGQVPFINKFGRRVQARQPNFKVLHAGLEYLGRSLGLPEDELMNDIAQAGQECFDACVEYAENTIDEEELTNSTYPKPAAVEQSDCPF